MATPSSSARPAVTPGAHLARQRFRSPQTVIGRFVARRTMRGAAFWGLVFGGFVLAKGTSFATAYPTAAGRAQLAATFGSSVGLSALLGTPHHINTVVGFTVWNTLSGMMIIGAIWAFLLATRTLRGEEDAGRWELLLSGQTTARRAAANVLAGLTASLLVLYGVTAGLFIAIGRVHTIDFSVGAALFFALAAVASAAIFMMLGALASQLMPTRSRAASFTAAIFGVCFLVRAAGDTTSAHWLLNLTPLGWIENLQPLSGSQPLWLIPITTLILVLAALAIFLAGRRDLGASTFADRDSAPARTLLLNTPLAAALRLTRTASLSWLLAITAFAVFFGLLTNSAAKAFSASAAAAGIINRLAQSSSSLGATTFLGVVMLILMTLMMAYAASAIGAVREEEASGYLDNLLVRPVGRLQWLAGRVALIVATTVVAGLLAGLGTWFGAHSQGVSISLHSLLLAGINATPPALCVLGVGVLALGVLPRLTSGLAYAVLGWSFLIQLVSSGLNLNRWLLDTSVLHYVSLAPAADPKWGTDLTMVGVALLLSLIGALAFNRRDLATE